MPYADTVLVFSYYTYLPESHQTQVKLRKFFWVWIHDNEEIGGGHIFIFLKDIKLSDADIIFRYSWKVLIYYRLESFLGILVGTMMLKFRKIAPMLSVERYAYIAFHMCMRMYLVYVSTYI